MGKTVPTIVLQPLTWGGVSYQPGTTLALPVIDALTFKRKRLVSLTRKAAPPEPIAPPPPPPPPPPPDPPTRRRYKRRDLQAEETATVPLEPSPAVVEPSAPTADPVPVAVPDEVS